jgi:putative inorganic carbon (hco3(-)) transporter
VVSPAAFPVAVSLRDHSGPQARLLQVLAALTVALAPIEGYLLDANENLGKVVPALFVASWIAVRVQERRWPARHPVHAPIAALAFVVVASTAVNVTSPYALEYMIRWLPFLAVTVALLDVVAREVPVRLVAVAAVTGALVAAGGALISFFVLDEARASGPLEDPNDLAYVIVAALPLLVVAVSRLRHRRWAISLVAVVAVVLILGMAVTLSRGGMLALGAAALWLVARKVVPVKAVAAVVLAALAAVLLAFVVAEPLMARALDQKSYVAGSNVDSRSFRGQIAARILAEHPVLGVGPGGFRSEYAGVSRNAEPAEQTPVAHNMYLEVAAELGLVGFAAFVCTIGAALLATERALRAGAEPWVVFGVQASLLAVLVASTFLSEQYYMPLWSMIAVGCALQLRAETRLS